MQRQRRRRDLLLEWFLGTNRRTREHNNDDLTHNDIKPFYLNKWVWRVLGLALLWLLFLGFLIAHS